MSESRLARRHLGTGSRLAYPLALLVVATVTFVAYAAVDAPLFNPATSVDPWLYTGAFENLDFVYQHFGTTYYVSRLPWIIPGHIAYSIFSPTRAYFVLNFSYFLAGGVFVSLLVRRFFGTGAAIVAFAFLLATPIYWDANYWEYVDGPELTYLLATMYFLLAQPHDRRLRLVWTGLSGFFAAAAITTQLFATFFVLLFAIIVVAVNARRPLHPTRAFGENAAAFVAGGIGLELVCGAFAKAHGGEILFFMPQIRYLQAANPASYHNPHYDWGNQPRILVPLFLLALLLVALALHRRRRDRMLRMALGCGLVLFVAYVVLGAWEFFGSGTSFELPDRFVQLEVGIVPVAAAIFAYLVRDLPPRARAVAVAVGVVAAIAPLLVVYGRNGARATIGGTGMRVAVGLMIAGLVAAVLTFVLRRGRAPAAVAAVALLMFAANWALAASHETEVWFREASQLYAIVPRAGGGVGEASGLELSSSQGNRDAFELGMNLIRYLRSNGYQSLQPFFWYDQAAAPYLEGIQSLYYYSYSYVGVSMPKIDADFRYRMRVYTPRELVLLCSSPSCRGALPTLAAAGYLYHPIAHRLLSEGAERVWVRVLRAGR